MDLRLGAWEDVLADVEVDAVITDPPYSERTHSGHDIAATSLGRGARKRSPRRAMTYGAWGPREIDEFVGEWVHRCRGWFVALTSHDLAPEWIGELESYGRYVFPPVPCVIRGMTCRLTGDGPSSWTVWAIVARPRNLAFRSWGTLPGAYVLSDSRNGSGHIGGKPLDLMRAIVRDYSRPGDLVCDPCAGYGTTLRAAIAEGRRAIGAEVDPDTHARALGLVTAETERGQLSLLEAP